MLPFRPTDDANVRPLADEDHQLLLRLVSRYGIPSLLCALTGSPVSSGASTFSANTLLSSMSAPSLAWTSSAASQARSDDASIHTQCTWPDVATDLQSMPDPEPTKISERSWLDSPAPVASPLPASEVTSHPSPRLISPTSKKYQCPMCFLDNSPVGFGRKSDFKKHLHNFHGSDVVWICHTKGCHLSFSTERAYSTHAKEAHRMKALPNSAARTELCTQVVFSCGFAACKDRLFEAATADEASTTRDKHFEHIAKHFEEGYDVRQWEYRVQIQNLMRQPQVKPVWKTCVWPKEKRQHLYWRPRSSGDLKRILECRHIGSDVSQLVRLAYFLGMAPYTLPSTPPMNNLESFFQLPYRSLCLIDTPGHTAMNPSPKPEEETAPPAAVTPSKRRPSRSSLTQSVFRLSGRQSKRASRPPTPASSMGGGPGSASGSGSGDTVMGDGDEFTTGPHPGTPLHIPNEAMHTPVESQPLMYSMHMAHTPHQSWCTMDFEDPFPAQAGISQGVYDYTMSSSQGPTTRPATPPVRSMKKESPHDSPVYPPEMMPVMMGM
ncbi:hypothetical protein CDD81_3421 [Ophiocordyceps australis]|uniref:C2H2-type domain-containing protein n=1 Tax=Ophiocordyceps australis TaxID=1399860 RepID=A0A2C5YBM9_9HYPO|nr:hypothetical protein CDD81_3421 [Ophiocordyceps australis]